MNIIDEIRVEFEKRTGLSDLPYRVIEKSSGPVIVFEVAYASERLFDILEEVREDLSSTDEDAPLATIRTKAKKNLIESPEGQLLLKTLSETQNVNRYTFGDDFFTRYTRSVAGAESQIIANANHLVLGRRGAGKSMLLLYAWHTRKSEKSPSLWVDMQVYSGRGDLGVAIEVLKQLIEQVSEIAEEIRDSTEIIRNLKRCKEDLAEVRKLLPEIRRYFGRVSSQQSNLFIFLDDFHVIDTEIQPIVLDVLYAVTRGNRAYLKLSAIETLVRSYESAGKVGLEIPQDAQYIRLDYNLTMPDKATDHIEAILNSHAQFAGIRSVRRLCTSHDVTARLTWVAAGVPRDALSLFSQAMTRASSEGRARVSVSNVNVAASETLSTKLRELDTDASEKAGDLGQLLDQIKEFCVSQKRKNAFLVESGSNPGKYDLVQNLVHLRLLHVISEGITVGEAGRKFIGLILDYGFYTGIRAAQSVDLFNKQSDRVSYKELRRLPVFRLD